MQDQPQAAVSVILHYAGKVLLVRRANPPAKDLYAFPGGRVDEGETLEQAALREVREETGITAEAPLPLRVYDLVEKDEAGTVTSWFELTVFTADPAQGAAIEPEAADDALEARWFTLKEALELPMPESVRECLLELLDEAERQA